MEDAKLNRNSALPPVALTLLIGATGWYLLHELAPLLRPLLLAVFLCYVIVPNYHGLRAQFPSPLSVILLAALTGLVMYVVVLVVQDNVMTMREELPRLTNRAKDFFGRGRSIIYETMPWMAPTPEEAERMDERRVAMFRDTLSAALNVGAGVLAQAGIVAIYLLFLLLDVSRWPGRLRYAFDREQGENILAVASKINASIAGYFRVKVLTSLLLAVGIALITWSTGTSFPVLWALINFLGNFIPYLGSIVGFTMPAVFGFLDHETPWPPIVAAVLMLAWHLALAYVLEPRITGKAVGLSPLFILISLSFWGLCWGITGMFLAVPLTTILKIVLDNIPYTQPLARMLGDE